MQSTLRQTLHDLGLGNRYAGYVPKFRIEEFAKDQWWILDGDIKVGLLTRPADFAELVNFDPFKPRRDLAFPKYYHAPTQPGDRITIAKWVNAQSTTSDKNTLTVSATPQGVTAVFTESWKNGRTATKRLTWCIDPDFGYVLHGEDEMRSPQPETHEYTNFLPRGAVDDRPESGRYPYILWQHPSGRIIRQNHNNIGARALGAMDYHDRRRLATDGFIGFFGEPDRNAAIELLESVPGSNSGTCPNMLDEHICWLPLDVESPPRQTDGTYLNRAVFNLVSVPPAVSDALNGRAEMLDLVVDRVDPVMAERQAWCEAEFPHRTGEPKHLRFCPIRFGEVADFETVLDPAAIFRGEVFPYPIDPDAPIAVVADCAHSGRCSLRVRVDGHPQHVEPTGCSFHVNEGQRYRLSAWVKTELKDGEAALSAVEYLYSPGSGTTPHIATPLQGTHAWQRLAVEFVPGENAHVVMVRFQVTGHGTAWFDDVLLEKA